jgi:16S rRNA (uracil1498-N3)-methyltransferase
MTYPRFLVPELPNQGTIELPPDEAHHASRVLRCSKDDAIVLFDGLGNEAIATIQSIDKRCVRAGIQSYAFAPRDHSGRLHFAIAMPKGDRQRNTIEKLVELGVDSLSPLETTRSVAVVNEAKVERLDRYVVEACKQCGRNRLMSIRPKVSVNDIRDYSHSIVANQDSDSIAIWILHPNIAGQRSHNIHDANALAKSHEKLLFLVGPEGGFTDREVVVAVAQGARILSLGERIQRVETAAATAAVLGHCWLAE